MNEIIKLVHNFRYKSLLRLQIKVDVDPKACIDIVIELIHDQPLLSRRSK